MTANGMQSPLTKLSYNSVIDKYKQVKLLGLNLNSSEAFLVVVLAGKE